MSITYQDIINVLCNNDKFSTNLNIMKFVDQFKYFKDIFDSNFYRYGIYNYNKEYDNISFISSIIYCIDDNYFIMSKDSLFDNINSIRKYLDKDFQIVDKLNLNLIIFDFKTNEIKSLYGGEYFNPYKETIFLANYDNYWEPICSKEQKTFNINSPILKNKILFNNIKYYNTDKVFSINDNYLEIAEENFQIITEIEDDSFTTQKNMVNNLTKNKLNKMNKGDILQLINDLNIDIQNLKPTKSKLIELISCC